MSIYDPIEELLSPAEDAALRRSMTSDEALAWQFRRAYAASMARRRNVVKRRRHDGLRLRLSAEEGLTKGQAARILRLPYYFQCPPLDSLSLPRLRTWNKRTNYLGDEYSEPGGRPLRPFTFRTLAVEWGGFVVEEFWDVDWLVESLQDLCDAASPVRLLGTTHYGSSAVIDAVVGMESVTSELRAGENDAVYLDLTFTEYRDPVTQRKGLGKRWPQTVTVRRDGSWAYGGGSSRYQTPLTFQVLAELAYGKPTLARHIMKAQKPPINDWGTTTLIIRHHRFKGKGGKLIIPAPPS